MEKNLAYNGRRCGRLGLVYERLGVPGNTRLKKKNRNEIVDIL